MIQHSIHELQNKLQRLQMNSGEAVLEIDDPGEVVDEDIFDLIQENKKPFRSNKKLLREIKNDIRLFVFVTSNIKTKEFIERQKVSSENIIFKIRYTKTKITVTVYKDDGEIKLRVKGRFAGKEY